MLRRSHKVRQQQNFVSADFRRGRWSNRFWNSCYMKNSKQRHMQDSGQQHIHPPVPPIVIYFRQLSSEMFNICPDFGWLDYVVKPIYLVSTAKYLSRSQTLPQFLHLWALTPAYSMGLRLCPDIITHLCRFCLFLKDLFEPHHRYWEDKGFLWYDKKGRVRKIHLSSSMSWSR